MFGLDSLTGGGAFQGSSASVATAGPITVGGLTFAPSNKNTLMTAAIVVVGVLAAFALVKGR